MTSESGNVEWRSVYSSSVKQVGYDEGTGEMHVIWSDDGHSIYGNVPRHEFDAVIKGWSVGKAIHQRVKGKYVHRYA